MAADPTILLGVDGKIFSANRALHLRELRFRLRSDRDPLVGAGRVHVDNVVELKNLWDVSLEVAAARPRPAAALSRAAECA
jgi:hypothetical protein